jgi:hypothetical protein
MTVEIKEYEGFIAKPEESPAKKPKKPKKKPAGTK